MSIDFDSVKRLQQARWDNPRVGDPAGQTLSDFAHRGPVVGKIDAPAPSPSVIEEAISFHQEIGQRLEAVSLKLIAHHQEMFGPVALPNENAATTQQGEPLSRAAVLGALGRQIAGQLRTLEAIAEAYVQNV